LPVEIRSCQPTEDRHHYRMGCRIHGLDETTRGRLIEYCYVTQPARQHGAPSTLSPPDEKTVGREAQVS